MKSCNNCGNHILDDAKFCPECGHKQTDGCPSCGEKYGIQDRFCAHCGYLLPGSDRHASLEGLLLPAPLSFAGLKAEVLQLRVDKDDEEGDVTVTLEVSITNETETTIEYIEIAAVLRNGDQLIVCHEKIEDDCDIDPQASETRELLFHGIKDGLIPRQAGLSADLSITAYSKQVTIWSDGIPSAIAGPMQPLGGYVSSTEPDDEGNQASEARIFLRNRTSLYMPKVTVTGNVECLEDSEDIDLWMSETIAPGEVIEFSQWESDRITSAQDLGTAEVPIEITATIPLSQVNIHYAQGQSKVGAAKAQQKQNEKRKELENPMETGGLFSVEIRGYGTEAVVGTITEEQFEFWVEREDDLDEHMGDWDNEMDIPDNMSLREWHDQDDIAHGSGPIIGETSITVLNSEGDEIWGCAFDRQTCFDHGITLREDKRITAESLGTGFYFFGYTNEKGTPFTAEVQSDTFDPRLLSIIYERIIDHDVAYAINYDDEEVFGESGDTRTNSTQFGVFSVDNADAKNISKTDSNTSSIQAATTAPPTRVDIRFAEGPFGLQILETEADGPDSDGDVRFSVKGVLTNFGKEDVEFINSKLVVLNGAGLPVVDSNDEIEEFAAPGESIEINVGSGYCKNLCFGTKQKPRDAQFLIQLTPCSCSFVELPNLPLCAPGEINGRNEPIEIAPGIHLQNVTIQVGTPDDDGDCRIEVKAIILNQSELPILRAELSNRIIDANGRELETSRTQEAIPPKSSIPLEDSYWGIKSNKLTGAQIVFAVKIYKALGRQELSWVIGSLPDPLESTIKIEMSATQQSNLGDGDRASALKPSQIQSIHQGNFHSSVEAATYTKPDDDGSSRYSVGVSVTNEGDEPIELLLARLIMLHPSGLVLASTDDEVDNIAKFQETITIQPSIWSPDSCDLEDQVEKARLLLQLTPCSCQHKDLVGLDAPEVGSIQAATSPQVIREGVVVETLTVYSQPPDEGECQIEINALIHNNSNHPIPRCRINSRLIDGNGSELDSSYCQEEIPAGARVVMADSFYGIKPKRLAGSKLQFNIKAYSAIGTDLIAIGEIDLEKD